MSAPEKDFLRATISYSPSFQDYCQSEVSDDHKTGLAAK